MLDATVCISCGHLKSDHTLKEPSFGTREFVKPNYEKALSECPGFEPVSTEKDVHQENSVSLVEEEEYLEELRPQGKSSSHWD
jgi:hypothetical protein